MIVAAVPQTSDKMSILRLALEIISKDSTIPEEIVDKTNIVLQIAIQLANTRSSITKDVPGESLRLAVRMRADDGFMKEVASITDIRQVDASKAIRMLHDMDGRFAQLV